MGSTGSRGNTVIACLRHRNGPVAIDWLCNASGFVRHAVYADGDPVHHAQGWFGSYDPWMT